MRQTKFIASKMICSVHLPADTTQRQAMDARQLQRARVANAVVSLVTQDPRGRDTNALESTKTCK